MMRRLFKWQTQQHQKSKLKQRLPIHQQTHNNNHQRDIVNQVLLELVVVESVTRQIDMEEDLKYYDCETKYNDCIPEQKIELPNVTVPEVTPVTDSDCVVQSPCSSSEGSSSTPPSIYTPDIRINIYCEKQKPPPRSTPPLFPIMAQIASFAKETNGYAETDPKSKEIAGLGDS